MTDQELRAALRQRYGERCGYCGVHESEAGTELEIDHFQPRAAGGTDELDNLIYCCPTCNRLKGDFWPASTDPASPRRLLHPERDDLAAHLREEADCRLSALSPTGAFHLERLRLNRAPLVALRQARREVAQLREALATAQAEQTRLHARIAALERDVHAVMDQLARLAEP